MPAQGLFISDLHLLSRRSIGERCLEQLKPTLKKTDLLILGGDIFDFRWSHHGELTRSLKAAQEWLGELLTAEEHLRLIYLLGNHDCLPAMQEMLHQLAGETPNFCWSEHHLALDHCLFLHGDVLDAGLSHAKLTAYRSKFAEQHRERGDIAHRLYDMVVATRMHHLPAQLLHHPTRVMRKLSNYLTSLNLSAEDGIKEVYFGHTHRPLAGTSYQGQLFFNSGSGVRHLPFRPCRFEFSGDVDEVVTKLTAEPRQTLRISK